MIEFGPEICRDAAAAEEREWLVTNGLGGFAAGTVAGTLTRRYHGLLSAALQPPGGRTLLVSKLDEIITHAGSSYPIFTNRWAGGSREPDGYKHIESFHLDGTTPVWNFRLGDAILEKRIWMQPDANTTYVRYSLLQADAPVELNIKTFVNYRSIHAETRSSAGGMQINSLKHGLRVTAFDGAVPFYLLSSQARARPEHLWHHDYFLEKEAYRGLPDTEGHLLAGRFETDLDPGTTCTLAFSLDQAPILDGTAAYQLRLAHEAQLIEHAADHLSENELGGGTDTSHLVLAADAFIVRRSLPEDPEGRSVIAGYPWFSDWGRDTMIALPGLTLATGRPDIARRILRTYAHYVDRGMLPNRFPEAGDAPEYNTVDAALWYFEAVRAYFAATGDLGLIRELYPTLTEIVRHYRDGTRFNIHVDRSDGLVFAGEPGRQLTWMDAKVGDWVVTARIGKPVEINALWYNALRSMVNFAAELGKESSGFVQMADQVRAGFRRFWNPAAGYCFDVLETDEGDDSSLRPNQLFAVSLAHSPLSKEHQKAVVDACGAALLTPRGLRSLAPQDAGYAGRYGGPPLARDGVYHQGTVWGWLIGPFVQAHLRVYADKVKARSFLRPLLDDLRAHGLGQLSEIFDGDRPFTPRGAFAQAWTVAEVLRMWVETG